MDRWRITTIDTVTRRIVAEIDVTGAMAAWELAAQLCCEQNHVVLLEPVPPAECDLERMEFLRALLYTTELTSPDRTLH